jgi:peptidoglycan/LPS O-acetylase OafA/YrhL
MRYRPVLDGLRGVFVLAVLYFHAAETYPNLRYPGGFLSVDVFFVISGALITILLLAEHDRTGRISLTAFYGRRALRLFPALLATVAWLTVVVAGFGLSKGQSFARSAAETLLYVANWAELAGANLGYLTHTWSLSIEEQFYLVWAVLLVVLLKHGVRRERLLAGAVAAVVVIWVVRAAVVLTLHPNPNRYLYLNTFARADTIAAGVALGITATVPAVRARLRVLDSAAAAAAGLLVVLAISTFALIRDEWIWIWGYPVVIVCVVVVVGHGLRRDTGPVVGVLGSSPLVWLGRRSYALYLIHLPVLQLWGRVVGHDTWHGAAYIGSGAAVSIAGAALSWRYVEQPFLALKNRRLVRVPVEPALSGTPSSGTT